MFYLELLQVRQLSQLLDLLVLECDPVVDEVFAEHSAGQEIVLVGVDQHLHEALGLAGFAGAADALHRHLRAQHALATGQGFSLRHADAAQRWVDEQRVARDAVADAARVGVEQVRLSDQLLNSNLTESLFRPAHLVAQ